MTATRRIFVLLGAPLVVTVGLVAVWGFRNGADMMDQVETWARQLEHSPAPVVMHLPFLPVYVDGKRVGKLQSVVVQRTVPGAVDSLELRIGGSTTLPPADCLLRLDVGAFDADGPFALKRLMRCAADTTGLVPFGSVVFSGADGARRLYLAVEHVPCDHLSDADAGASCLEVARELKAIKREIRNEIRFELRNLRNEIRSEVRSSVRGH